MHKRRSEARVEKVLAHEIMKAEHVVKLSKEKQAPSDLIFEPRSSTLTRRPENPAVRARIGSHPQGERSPPAFWEYPRFAARQVAEITIYLGLRERMKPGLVGSGAYRRQTRPRS
jgi:hypothetical protein